MPRVARRRAQAPLREFALIAQIQKRFGETGRLVIRGIGDDAAVIRPSAGRDLLITTDLLAEGVHFDRATATWEQVGVKAAVANLSDIAAMGGRADYLLVSIAVPVGQRAEEIHQLYRGLWRASRPYGVQLIGGDTSASHHGVFVSLTVMGSVPRGLALMRTGAQPGDAIYVTGTLGDSRAGLDLLRKGPHDVRHRVPGNDASHLISRHLEPTPRLEIAQLLSARRLASAAIDISDGLSGDLRHLCGESGVGAEIDKTALPLSEALRAYAAVTKQEAADVALEGGEDYELLLAVPPTKAALAQRLGRRLRCPLTPIGRIQPKSAGIMLKEANGKRRPLPLLSYEHFQKRSPRRETPCCH